MAVPASVTSGLLIGLILDFQQLSYQSLRRGFFARLTLEEIDEGPSILLSGPHRSCAWVRIHSGDATSSDEVEAFRRKRIRRSRIVPLYSH